MSRVALLIGIGDYHVGLKSIPASSKDAEKFSHVLESLDFCHFQTVKVLNEKTASAPVSRNQVAETLESWCQQHEADDFALLYISGHLLWDDADEVRLAVCETFDQQGKLRRSRTISFSFVKSCLESSAAREQVVIVDGCMGDGAIAPRSSSQRRSMYESAANESAEPLSASQPRRLNLEQRLGGDRRIVLAATQVAAGSGSYSPEHKQDGSTATHLSTYTHFLIEGIRTGLADHNRDGQISLHELHRYIKSQMAIATPAITPTLIGTTNLAQSLKISKTNLTAACFEYCDAIQDVLKHYPYESIRPLFQSPQHQSSLHPAFQTLLQVQQQSRLKHKTAAQLRQVVFGSHEQFRCRLSRYRALAARLIQRDVSTLTQWPDEVQHQADGSSKHSDHETSQPIEDLSSFEEWDELQEREDYEGWSELTHLGDYIDASELPNRNGDHESQPSPHQQGNGNHQPASNASHHDGGGCSLPLESQSNDPAEPSRASFRTVHANADVHRAASNQGGANSNQNLEHALTQRDIEWLDQVRDRLGLREADVADIKDEMAYVLRLNRLTLYRQTYANAVQSEHPLSTASQDMLASLQHRLQLSDDDVRQIEQEQVAYEQARQQKLEQYRITFTDAVRQGVVRHSGVREALEHFQHVLGLSDADVERLETEVQHQMMGPSFYPASPEPDPESDGDRQRRLQEYKDAFAAAARQQLPMPTHVIDSLRRLRQQLQLDESDVESIRQEIMQTIRDEANQRIRNLDEYQRAFEQSVSESFPISSEERSRLNALSQSLNLTSQEVKQIEQLVERQWRLQHQAETNAPHAPSEDEDDAQSSEAGEPSEHTVSDSADSPQAGAHPSRSEAATPNEAVSEAALTASETNGDTPSTPSEDSLPATQLDPTGLYAGPISPNGYGTAGGPPSDTASSEPLPESEKGESYEQLQHFLQERQWKDADEETRRIMLKLGSTEAHLADWVDHQAIANLPCADLHTLDRLWVEHSQGQFGFSVQAQIYFNSDPRSPVVNGNMLDFGKAVDWVQLNRGFLGLKFYNQLKLESFQIPRGHQGLRGHLPAKWFWDVPWWVSLRLGGVGTGRGGCGDDDGILFTFMSKLVTCGVTAQHRQP